MTALVLTIVEVTLVLCLALTAAALFQRRSAALRHAVLTTAVAIACAMPALKLLVPQAPVFTWPAARVESSGLTLTSDAVGAAAAVASTTDATGHASRWPIVLLAIWLAGAAAIGAAFLAGLVTLARVRARSRPAGGRWGELADDLARRCGVRRRVTLLQSDDASLLVTCGVLAPRIILPAAAADWPDDRKRIVLRHELAHIKRHDSAIQAAGELLRVVQWFNPVVWLVCRRLRQESEYASDDAVLAAGVEPTQYATELLGVARDLSQRHRAWVAAAAIAHPSTLERRIAAMLHRHRNRAPLGRRGWRAAALVALAVSIPLAAAGIAPAGSAAPVASVARDVTLAAASTAAPTDRLAHAAPAARRQATGSIGGTLFDQSGAVIPGATVALIAIDTGAQSVTRTDVAGHFVFQGLPPASYHVVASQMGFKTATIDVALKPGSAIEPTLTLALGAVHETIHVVCGETSAAFRLLESSARIADALFPRLYAQGAPVRVGGNIRQPLKLSDTKPACPSTVPSAEITVHVVGHIGVNGLIEDAALAPAAPGSEPPSELTQSALDAIRRWTFAPTLLDGQPVETEIAVDVTFGRS